MGLNEPIVDENAREITVVVLEKKGGSYAASIGNPQKDQAARDLKRRHS